MVHADHCGAGHEYSSACRACPQRSAPARYHRLAGRAQPGCLAHTLQVPTTPDAPWHGHETRRGWTPPPAETAGCSQAQRQSGTSAQRRGEVLKVPRADACTRRVGTGLNNVLQLPRVQTLRMAIDLHPRQLIRCAVLAISPLQQPRFQPGQLGSKPGLQGLDFRLSTICSLRRHPVINVQLKHWTPRAAARRAGLAGAATGLQRGPDAGCQTPSRQS